MLIGIFPLNVKWLHTFLYITNPTDTLTLAARQMTNLGDSLKQTQKILSNNIC